MLQSVSGTGLALNGLYDFYGDYALLVYYSLHNKFYCFRIDFYLVF